MDTSDKNYKKLSQKLTKIDPPKNLFYECPFRTFNRAKPFTLRGRSTTKIVVNCSKLTKIVFVEVKCKFKSVRTIIPCNKQIFNKLKKNLYIFSGR